MPYVTEVVALATAVVVLITALVTFRTRGAVKQIHILVNSKMTAALERIEQLTIALEESNTEVPDEQ